MVPEGWDVLPFGEVAEFRNGLNFTKDDDGETIKVVGIPDFWQKTQLTDFSNLKTIKCRGDIGAANLLHSGDLLFVRSNGNPELVGRCLYFPSVDEPISFSGFTIRARVNPERMMPTFAALVMNSEIPRVQFRRSGGGTNISNLSQDALGLLSVPLPPLAEQKRIAEVLGVWDRATLVAGQQLDLARTQKRALMQTLLTPTRRFPGFDGQPWKEVRLGDVADIKIGGTPSRAEPAYWAQGEEGHTWLSIADLGPKMLNRSKETITDEGVRRSNVKPVAAGTVVMSFKLTIGKLGIAAVPLYTNEAICAITPSNQNSFEPTFLYHLLQVTDLLGDVDQAVKGKTLNKAKLLELQIKLPDLSEQRVIAAVLDEQDELVETYETQITRLQAEKKALMQQLLTGKKRLAV